MRSAPIWSVSAIGELLNGGLLIGGLILFAERFDFGIRRRGKLGTPLLLYLDSFGESR